MPTCCGADAILVCDAGNFAVGVPSLTTSLRGLANVWVTVRTLSSPMHSGMFGGAAPDALAALIAMLATLRDEHGNTTISGLDATQSWPGAAYPAEQFRKDANVLDGVDLLGGSVADMVWARPAATVLGIDCPPVVGSSAAIQPEARARINLRVPPGMDAKQAQDALIEHLAAVAPGMSSSSSNEKPTASRSSGTLDGPGYDAMASAMRDAYGRDLVTQGQGGSIPLCNVFAETLPAGGDHAHRRRGAPAASFMHRTRASTRPRSPTWPWSKRCSSRTTQPPSPSTGVLTVRGISWRYPLRGVHGQCPASSPSSAGSDPMTGAGCAAT